MAGSSSGSSTNNRYTLQVLFVTMIRKIKEDLQPYNSLPDDDERNITIKMITKTVLDFSLQSLGIKLRMFPKRFFPKMEIMSFFGMAGIGKTILVKKIFEDQSILCRFDHHVWVTLGPKYESEQILMDILAQIYPYIDKMHIKGDAELFNDLCAQLSNKRCLIVLDDVWSQEPLHYMKILLPDLKGEVLMTTRLGKVTQLGRRDLVHQMRLLNKEESWCLLRQKVFANGLCSPELEKAGKRISENCEGLPLLILKVADLLSKAERTPEYWNKVADRENSVFMNAQNEISKALRPSYMNLPQHLKACFLYMGVFPQNYEIPTSKLKKLWVAEGFLEPNQSQPVEDFAAECLSGLANRSLVVVCQKGSNPVRVKTSRLHSVFWHFSNSEAMESKFFHALNTYADNSMEGIKSQRRLCIRNSILLGIKDVHNSMASISAAHSLLCTGPPHQYAVPIHLGLTLLRVLDALTIRFYSFPIEVVKLIHLRYLALTCNENPPASISKLRKLEYLIVSRRLSIKSCGGSLYLPVEIWAMKELKHLQIMGSNLPSPNWDADLLPNLLTLLHVSHHNCTEGVLKRIPNLKKLGVQIELAPDDDGKHLHCLNCISHLHGLESLKCVVVNPELRSEVAAPPTPVSMFPWGLKKLSLSGLGYPWEYMSIIGQLRNLEVLKLRCYAFRGPEWITNFNEFQDLKFLSIEDTDLVRLEFKVPSLVELKRLILKHCYKLEELPYYLSGSVKMIEVVDCNPTAVAWAKQRKERNFKNPLTSRTLELQVHSSWDAGKLEQ